MRIINSFIKCIVCTVVQKKTTTKKKKNNNKKKKKKKKKLFLLLSFHVQLYYLHVLHSSENFILSLINPLVYFQWKVCIQEILSIYHGLEEHPSVIKFLLLEDEKHCHIFSKVAEVFFEIMHILRVAIVIPPSVQPRNCPLRLSFFFQELEKGSLETHMRPGRLISAVYRYLSSRSTS